MFWNIDRQLAGHLFHARRRRWSLRPRGAAARLISISLSSSWPSRSFCGTFDGRQKAPAAVRPAPSYFCGWDQYVENTLFRQLFRTIAFLDSSYANHFTAASVRSRMIESTFPDIAHFGERWLDFNERRVGESLPDDGRFSVSRRRRANHQNIFRRYFVAQLFIKLHTTPAVTYVIATERFALSSPIMCLFSSLTISRGVISDMRGPYALAVNSSMVWKWLVQMQISPAHPTPFQQFRARRARYFPTERERQPGHKDRPPEPIVLQIVLLYHIAATRDDERGGFIRDGQQRFQFA